MEEDAEVEDIFNKKPKKIKSGKKGKRVELELVKALNQRFQKTLAANPDLGSFSRSIGSGNRWGQNVHLSRTATTPTPATSYVQTTSNSSLSQRADTTT